MFPIAESSPQPWKTRNTGGRVLLCVQNKSPDRSQDGEKNSSDEWNLKSMVTGKDVSESTEQKKYSIFF